ncbi:hypothetical protein NDU88_004525 [Pleurodeles waltl]|uniref:Uncharacterized protein n=1 Tax=Pleurodeles waltl TaxID=8319 RepID=A0AAV7PFI1_PLEWA|nr:hypothetical protein NDU88_004525 [Pleurodeles waltl]
MERIDLPDPRECVKWQHKQRAPAGHSDRSQCLGRNERGLHRRDADARECEGLALGCWGFPWVPGGLEDAEGKTPT